jgi:7-cyano-7-deazaguanine synthase in queuosine biosynthesis
MTRRTLVVCNDAPIPKRNRGDDNVLVLEYRPGFRERNVRIGLRNFVTSVFHLPDRILDLLEIAAYVFAADRKITRGRRDAVEYQAWERSIKFTIRVRDYRFWQKPDVKKILVELLAFMTGDREYEFEFYSGHKTEITSLFDREEFRLEPGGSPSVVLFSGGLDSLTGAYERLKYGDEVYLVSHRSGQPSTYFTQKKLAEALQKEFPGRVFHYSFLGGLTQGHAAEETQRTRAFLFTSIAYALAYALRQETLYIYENGVTSINLWRRQDCINGRTSRTTHPKTIFLLSKLLSKINEAPFQLINPFNLMTKAEVFEKMVELNGQHLIDSSVSCSRTYQKLDVGTHCGLCFQCIDRLLAACSSECQDYDKGIYAISIITDPIPSPEAKTTLRDYIRQAIEFGSSGIDSFFGQWANEFADVLEGVDKDDHERTIDQIWQMCRRHGKEVVKALKAIQSRYDNLSKPIPSGGLLECLGERTYLKPEARLLAEAIGKQLRKAIPIAFRTRKPKNEAALNDQIEALLKADQEEYKREFPNTLFALSSIIPDHMISKDLCIEAKYVRSSTPPSKVSEGIAADITKISATSYVLFLIYDPSRGIRNDDQFIGDIEKKRDCLVIIIR